jgi:hypothetical protein
MGSQEIGILEAKGAEDGTPRDQGGLEPCSGQDRVHFHFFILLTVTNLFYIPGMLRSFFSYFPSLVNEYGIHRPNVKSTRSPCLKK